MSELSQVAMGDDNDIREYVSIHLSSMPQWSTRLGDGNLIMGGCHVAHDCILGNRIILANGTLLAGHVTVDDMVGLLVTSPHLDFFLGEGVFRCCRYRDDILPSRNQRIPEGRILFPLSLSFSKKEKKEHI